MRKIISKKNDRLSGVFARNLTSEKKKLFLNLLELRLQFFLYEILLRKLRVTTAGADPRFCENKIAFFCLSILNSEINGKKRNKRKNVY